MTTTQILAALPNPFNEVHLPPRWTSTTRKPKGKPTKRK